MSVKSTSSKITAGKYQQNHTTSKIARLDSSIDDMDDSQSNNSRIQRGNNSLTDDQMGIQLK